MRMRRWTDSGSNLAYRVKISDSALIDAEDYVEFIRQTKREPKAADRWFRGLVSAVFSLADLPLRCPLIPETDDFPFELRQLIFHSHRIVFRLDEAGKTVEILRVYHGSRKKISPDDVDF
jgi:plasmid stabilization system protein ParE